MLIEHIQCARHNPKYLKTLISFSPLKTMLTVFPFPFCVRKVSHSLFGFQGKGRLGLAGSPPTFCQHRASIAVNLFYFHPLIYDFSLLNIRDVRGIFVLE